MLDIRKHLNYCPGLTEKILTAKMFESFFFIMKVKSVVLKLHPEMEKCHCNGGVIKNCLSSKCRADEYSLSSSR